MPKKVFPLLFLMTLIFGVSYAKAESNFTPSEEVCNPQVGEELSYEETRQCMMFYRGLAISTGTLKVQNSNLAITANSTGNLDPSTVEGQTPDSGIVMGQTPDSGIYMGQTPDSGIVEGQTPDSGIVHPETGITAHKKTLIKFLGF